MLVLIQTLWTIQICPDDGVARAGDQGTLVGMKRVASDVDVAGICARGLHNVSPEAVESCVWIED